MQFQAVCLREEMLHVQCSLLHIDSVRSVTVAKDINACLHLGSLMERKDLFCGTHKKQKYVAITCVIFICHFKQEIAFRSFSPDNLLLLTLLCS